MIFLYVKRNNIEKILSFFIFLLNIFKVRYNPWSSLMRKTDNNAAYHFQVLAHGTLQGGRENSEQIIKWKIHNPDGRGPLKLIYVYNGIREKYLHIK